MIKVIELMCLQPMLVIVHALNGQFIDDDQTLQDPQLYGSIMKNPRTPEQIRSQSKFIMRGGSQMLANGEKVQSAAQFISMFQNDLTPESKQILMRKVWGWMDGDPTVTEKLQAQPTPQQQSVNIDQQRATTEENQSQADIDAQDQGLTQ